MSAGPRLSPAAIQRVAEYALRNIDAVLEHWLPGGKHNGTEYTVLNPTRSDNHAGSFSVNMRSGQWGDFATDDKGGDLVSLVCYLERYANQSEAARLLSEFLGIDMDKPRLKVVSKTEWQPIIPVPEDAEPPPERHPKLGEPAARWTYHDAEGRVLCHVCRFNTTDSGKEFRPLTYRAANGTHAWRWEGLPDPRPLFNLHLLARHPSAAAIVCEGEKSAEAAAQLFPLPQYVTLTSLNGAKGVRKADWKPLEGRTLYLWPDNDKPGLEYVTVVAERLKSSCTLHALQMPDGVGEGWDAADALEQGFTAERLSWVKIDPKKKPSGPVQFSVTDSGVWYVGEEDVRHWICSRLDIAGEVRGEDQRNWGYLLQWHDADGVPHEWAMPSQMLSGSGEEYRRELLDGGLKLAPGQNSRNLLGVYIQTARPGARARCVRRCGWFDGVYVLPGCTIGDNGERIIFQSESATGNALSQRGTLQQWREEIASRCAGNSRLVFSVSLAFAAILAGETGDEPGGFHLVGDSSEGKTTILSAACSVYGRPKTTMKSWRTTANALEVVAAQHNHSLLCLDEIGKCPAKVVGETVYMLANGVGKLRMRAHGGLRPTDQWELLFLSTGELSLQQYLAAAGLDTRAGQEVRMLDIPSDAGAGMGCWEDLHGAASPKDFAEQLWQELTPKYYGTAAVAFIEGVISHRKDGLAGRIKALREDFEADYLLACARKNEVQLNTISGQVYRAAGRFSLVAAAGELASEWGITGWEELEATEAVGKCFQAWLEKRGGLGNRETDKILEQVKLFFELHGESRFVRWGADDEVDKRTIVNRAGAVKHQQDNDAPTFYVLPGVFRKELCSGYDSKKVIKVLTEAAMLERGDERVQQQYRLPLIGKTWCYVIKPFSTREA